MPRRPGVSHINRPARILLNTTIASTANDWSVNRFSLLADYLRSLEGESGAPLFDVTMRDRDPGGDPDAVLSVLDRSDFDQLWLFAVDVGNGLTASDCDAISRFRRKGGGLMVTRDHMDLGSSVCSLDGVGSAHHFHSRNIDPDALLEVDDPYTSNILWPNFHSGANGDFQAIRVTEPPHAVLINPGSPSGLIRFLPSHPHEGAVSAPTGQDARVIAIGTSKTTGRPFNIAVAFEASNGSGRAIAQSTFHHFADYNWNPEMGSPSFVTEPPGHGLAADPVAMADVHAYAANVARWLSHLSPEDQRRA
jgi:hypothetical protein